MTDDQNERIVLWLFEATTNLSLMSHAIASLSGPLYAEPRDEHTAKVLEMAESQMAEIGGRPVTYSHEGQVEHLERLRQRSEEDSDGDLDS